MRNNTKTQQTDLYQLEVKRYLVEHKFSPADGWEVTVDVDAMERAKGGQHPLDKHDRAQSAEDWLNREGISIGTHPRFGRADLVATRGEETFVVEVEGKSSRQKSSALYSVLGQTILLMKGDKRICYAIAFPDTSAWEDQLKKVPNYIRGRLPLTLWLVGKTRVRQPGR